MSRSFSQFSFGQLCLLRAVTGILMNLSRFEAGRARAERRTQDQSRADSDAARYERGLRWIERALDRA